MTSSSSSHTAQRPSTRVSAQNSEQSPAIVLPALTQPAAPTTAVVGLPSYKEVTDINAAPPSYESLFGQVRNASKTSNGLISFCKNLIIIFIGTVIGTVCCSVILAVTFVLPLATIVIGSVHAGDCPAEPALPVWLILGGVLCILRASQHSASYFRVKLFGPSTDAQISQHTYLLTAIQLLWYVVGCVIVYRMPQAVGVYPEGHVSGDSRHSSFCHPAVYTSAHYLLVLAHVLVLGFLLLVCCLLCVLSTVTRAAPRPQAPASLAPTSSASHVSADLPRVTCSHTVP